MMHLLAATIHEEASLYQFRQGNILMPGAESAVFLPLFTLPLFSIYGHGIRAGSPPNPLQPPQVMQGPVTRTSGLGGVIAGQMMLQGLTVPDDEG